MNPDEYDPLLELGSINPPVSKKDGETRGYMPGVAYAFTLNMIVGAGVLGLPYAYFEGGVLLSSVLLVILTMLAYSTMMFLVESMARAESWMTAEEGDIDGASDGRQLFVIRNRKFEVNEMCSMFLKIHVSEKSFWRVFSNDHGEIFFFRRLMEFSLFFYSLGSMWLYAAVVSSSLSAVIPFPFLGEYKDYSGIHGNVDLTICSNHDTTGLDAYCHQSYLFCLAMFCAVMLVVCLMDLTEQRALQMSLTAFAIIIMVLMVLTSSVAMTESRQDGASSSPPYVEHVSLANFNGFGKAFTTALFSQLCHQGVPSFISLIRDKRQGGMVFGAAMCTTLALYCCLGLITSLYFGPLLKPVVTLNWKSYTGGMDVAPWWATMISYLIVLFPVCTITAAFPIYAVVLVQSYLKSFPQRLVEKWGRVLNIVMRLGIVVLPIAGAALIKDVSKILEFNGIFGFFIAFFIPSLLQLRSHALAVKRWGPVAERTPYHWIGSHPMYCRFVLAISVFLFGFVVYEVLKDYTSG